MYYRHRQNKSSAFCVFMDMYGSFFVEILYKFWELEKSLYICTLERGIGLMAEWLGTALQKLLQRFESASDLQERYL